MEEEDNQGGRAGSSTAAGKEPAQQQVEPRLLKGEVQPLADGVDALELDADHCPRYLQTCSSAWRHEGLTHGAPSGVHICCVVIHSHWLPFPCCCRILVSSGHWPTSYLNKAKRCLQDHGRVQLSALGTAISAMVTGGRLNWQTALTLLCRGA